VDGRAGQLIHQASRGIFALLSARPDQQIDYHAVAALGDAARDEAWLLEQPGVDIGVGCDEIVDRQAGGQFEGRDLDRVQLMLSDQRSRMVVSAMVWANPAPNRPAGV
jgi:hypothetical protein